MLQVPDSDSVLQHKLVEQQQQKFYHDRGTKPLAPLQEGDNVRVRQQGKWSTKATVLRREEEPRSYTVRTERGGELRRNRRDLLHTTSDIRNQGDPYDSDNDVPDFMPDMDGRAAEMREQPGTADVGPQPEGPGAPPRRVITKPQRLIETI